MIQFQEYFQSDYPGFASFIDIIIKPIFGDSFKEVDYIDDMIDCLNDDPDELECYDEIEKSDENLKKLAKESGLQRILKLGTIKVQGGIRPIYVYDITVSKRRLLSRNRKGIQQLISRTLSNQSGAFMLFHYEDAKWEWRFSYKFVGKDQNDSTNSKRFTYLFGKNQVCKTAAQRFTKLLNKKCEIAIDDITDAFSVEALSKEFFDTYKAHYEHFCQFVYDNKRDSNYFGEEFSRWEDKTIRDYVKKLLGRIVFLHFLQKKGWMGVPVDKQWGEGDLKFMMNLFDSCSSEQKANYLDDVLEPMFEDLNNQRIDDIAGEWSNAYIIAEENSGIKIPYLNGGLFERETTDLPKSVFPADYFADLFDFFNQYNFTIDENDPNDAEVGIDPEMLGRIFENLLEDNKDKGAFYTPKEIVQYMCRESLIAYLQTDVEEDVKESYRQFVTTHEVNELRPADVFKVDKKLREVKICDPAIGSGAFPMGLLKELFNCRMAIEGLDEGKSPAEIKKDIIQNSIYGVDIEKGAVDIARLRFWLSLIIDEQTPNALPNMDFKIMRGNSLLEQYNGFDLGTIMNSKKKVVGPVQMTFFEDDVDVLRRQVIGLRREYFRETDKKKKKDLRQRMREIVQQQINTLSYNIDLSGIDIADNSEFFLWHTWFSDVFENGEFDIVIGNPPYIDSETMVKVMPKERVLYANKYECASGNWDLFVVFVELSISLLKEGGIFSNIIPNKLIAAKYGIAIRQKLSSKHVIEIRDYSRIDVFEDAAVYPITIVLRNSSNMGLSLFTIMQNRTEIKQSNIAKSSELLKNDYWDPFFTDAPIFKLISKLNDFCRLKELPVEVFGAATVGDAYEIKNMVQDSSDLDGFKLINSGTIDPYVAYWGIKQCRYIKSSYLYPKVPSIKLKKYSDVRFEQASSPKIIVASMTTKYEAFLDISGEFIAGKSTTIIQGTKKELYNLTAIINSKLASFWLNVVFKSLKMSGGAINIGKNELQNLPIPKAEYDFESLVQQIIDGKMVSHLNNTSELEHEIDRLVYRLYGLTEDEIQIIENKE